MASSDLGSAGQSVLGGGGTELPMATHRAGKEAASNGTLPVSS
jgi:hypothetical protein